VSITKQAGTDLPITKQAGTALAITIIGVLVIVPFLIWRAGWLFAGHVAFGLTIGLLVGMTQSSVVSATLPLLFTFAGGSIVALSVGTTRTSGQLDTLGMQLAGFGIGAIIGLLDGVILRKLDVQLPLGKFRES
jgi:hypothetical protein